MSTFACPSCGQTIAAEVARGSSVRCPLCDQVVTVPRSEVPVASPVRTIPPTEPLPPSGPPQPRRQGLAITSMVLGILGLVTGCAPILGVLALILGIVALVKGSRRPAEYGGQGFAIAGICLGGASLLLLLLWVPLLISILLPSLSRAREMAKRSVCAANLRGIGTAMQIYANSNGGQFPPDMDTLVRANLSLPAQFVCPSRDVDPVPPEAIGDSANRDRLAAVIHGSYEYILGQSEESDPLNVLLYEKPDAHVGEGGNVLFVDGHTQWIEPYSKVEDLVAETKTRLAARQAPSGVPP